MLLSAPYASRLLRRVIALQIWPRMCCTFYQCTKISCGCIFSNGSFSFMGTASNTLQEKGGAGFVFLPCTARRETSPRYACTRTQQLWVGFIFLCVCLLLFFNIPKSLLVLELKTSKQTKNPNRIWASHYICIQHLQSDLNKTRSLFRMTLESKQTSEELENTLKAHTNHTLNRHCTGLGFFSIIPNSS